MSTGKQRRYVGSSPLTRGKRDLPLSESLAEGLIPAHAGKTSLPALREDPQAAHPRSRRENAQRPGAYACACGSSPLTRGKLSHSGTSLHQVRLIPAHAGKTCGGRTRRRQAAAHPRSRGENMTIATDLKVSLGSSPLTRGKLRHQQIAAPGGRLIPAHAGKTRTMAASDPVITAHPRSRGENSLMASDRLLDPGSSPLTRGKRLCYCLSYAALGLIPAHAGKTATSRGTARYPPAHPRSRGENAEQQSNLPSPAGSSPLTRGKLGLSVSFGLLWRLIPAHAGKTRILELTL